MKNLIFAKEPTFAQLWDVCVRNHLYDSKKYVTEVDSLLQSCGISHRSKIIDTCAGGGFPAIDLMKRGYMIDCMDASSDQVDLFNVNAQSAGLDSRCKRLLWQDIPQNYAPGQFDFAFCRGNSFIYAGGGWNENQLVDEKSSLDAYKNTLSRFGGLLVSGGVLYLDKFTDRSLYSHPMINGKSVACHKVCDIIVGGEHLSLEFETMYNGKVRGATLYLRNSRGKKRGVENVTYPLRSSELESLARETGFVAQRVTLESEKYFDVWLLHKN